MINVLVVLLYSELEQQLVHKCIRTLQNQEDEICVLTSQVNHFFSTEMMTHDF